MLERIKKLNDGKDMTINTMSKINYQNVGYNKENSATTTTQAENTIVAIQRIEEALTRVQEHKRRCIESLHKMDIDDSKKGVLMESFQNIIEQAIAMVKELPE